MGGRMPQDGRRGRGENGFFWSEVINATAAATIA